MQAAYFQRINLSAQGFYIVPTERCGYDFNIPGDDNRARGQVQSNTGFSIIPKPHVKRAGQYLPARVWQYLHALVRTEWLDVLCL